MDFLYTDNPFKYTEFTNKRIYNSLCKHVLNLSSEKAKQVYNEGLEQYYKECMWGYADPYGKDYELNRAVQITNIERMIRKHHQQPCRYVIDSNGKLWVDNLHTAISWIWVKGQDVWLSSIPYYIVDLRGEVPIVVDANGSLSMNTGEIKGAIISAVNRNKRITPKLYDINYTIGEFIRENEIYPVNKP